ncbi:MULTISPECIES: PAS domain-containing protein [unclassified Nostoc]|uniref:PAS domain-containing protein n=1 Tax=unclassified Nostoc TaxID=2593658 RepID=UPI002AD3E4AA|nr:MULTISPECIES: PAS domain-containing protein [unclassified Nostoc]MDZ8030401.1 PAS domain-containing protein [Nostoc sp. DedSLP04]MDZ8092377.1 PAS domain-containing protein [Nostoc sp. DedQUE05]
MSPELIMNLNMFAQKLQSLQERLANLYEDANTTVQPESDLLLAVLKELDTASKTLEIATEKLFEQTQKLVNVQTRLREVYKRYQDLLNFIPNAYLVSDTQGKILSANRATATLFNLQQRFLVDKPLVCFIAVEKRQAFRSQLNQMHSSECDYVQEWILQIQPRDCEPFEAAMTVAPIRDVKGKLTGLRWMVRDTDRVSCQPLLSLER